MHDLPAAQLKKLVSAVSDMNSDPRGRELPERVMTALGEVVDSDIISCESFADETAILLPDLHWATDPQILTEEFEQICSSVFENHPFDNPLIVEQVFRKNRGVLKLSDFADRARFTKTVYYNEIMLRVGFDRQMAVMLPFGDGIEFSLALVRKGKDFTEKERLMLGLISAHVANTIALVIERDRRRHLERNIDRLMLSRADGAEEKPILILKNIGSFGLTPRQSEVLFWISEGKSDDVIAQLLGLSRRTVEKHAENIFEKLGVDSRTAAAVTYARLSGA